MLGASAGVATEAIKPIAAIRVEAIRARGLAGGVVFNFETGTGVDRVADGASGLDGLVQALSQAPAHLQLLLLAALAAVAVVLLLSALGVGTANAVVANPQTARWAGRCSPIVPKIFGSDVFHTTFPVLASRQPRNF